MRTYPQTLAKIIINEVSPRWKKHGMFPPTELTAALAILESEGEITRRDVRKVLDGFYAGKIGLDTKQKL